MSRHIGICGLLWAIAFLGCAKTPEPKPAEKKNASEAPSKQTTDAAKSTEATIDKATDNKPATDEGGPKLIGPGVSAPSTEAAKPTHVVLKAADYYTTGPQQGRPPDGKLEAGANVTLIESDGSYSKVKTAAGDEVFVATDALKPIGEETAAPKSDTK